MCELSLRRRHGLGDKVECPLRAEISPASHLLQYFRLGLGFYDAVKTRIRAASASRLSACPTLIRNQ